MCFNQTEIPSRLVASSPVASSVGFCEEASEQTPRGSWNNHDRYSTLDYIRSFACCPCSFVFSSSANPCRSLGVRMNGLTSLFGRLVGVSDMERIGKAVGDEG